MRVGIRNSLALLLLSFLTCVPTVLSEGRAWYEQVDFKRLDREARLRFAPLELQDGSKLTLVSPEEWAPLARELEGQMIEIHAFFGKIFGELPRFQTTLRLIPEKAFFEETGAPRWTNAMFYKGQIILPLSTDDQGIDFENIYRSLRHEYTHAVTHALSKGNCPGWLDEGLAQWFEGEVNPALGPALRDWLQKKRPVSFHLLRGGFTRLPSEMVPAAYAQSLYISRDLVEESGFQSMRLLFEDLASGSSFSLAFQRQFGRSIEDYERELGLKLDSWGKKHRHQELIDF